MFDYDKVPAGWQVLFFLYSSFFTSGLEKSTA